MSDEYRLAENVHLMDGILNEALYHSLRYHELGYDHLREDVLDDVERLRDFADEVLERERGNDG